VVGQRGSCGPDERTAGLAEIDVPVELVGRTQNSSPEKRFVSKRQTYAFGQVITDAKLRVGHYRKGIVRRGPTDVGSLNEETFWGQEVGPRREKWQAVLTGKVERRRIQSQSCASGGLDQESADAHTAPDAEVASEKRIVRQDYFTVQ
jgi:hypothetical protein